jgi:hypothetical protein
MRPLTHLGVGQDSKDYDLFKRDGELYDILMKRGHELLEEAKMKFMGAEFAKEPKYTRKELEEGLDRQLQKKTRLEELKAPPAVIDEVSEKIVKIYHLLDKKDYVAENDTYRTSYGKKRTAWENSVEKENLIKDIETYNEDQYQKLLETQSTA